MISIVSHIFFPPQNFNCSSTERVNSPFPWFVDHSFGLSLALIHLIEELLDGIGFQTKVIL